MRGTFPQIEGVRILAIGSDLRTPETAYRVVHPDEARDGGTSLDALAAEHGAVVFELPPARPGARAEPGMLLRVKGSWAILERDALSLGVATCASHDGGTRWRFLRLLADGSHGGDPLYPSSFVLEDRDAAGVWASDHWRLRPHPLLPRRPVRDWAWCRRSSAAGPVTIHVRIRRSRPELEAFLASCAPMPYARIDSPVYRMPHPGHIDQGRELRVLDGGLQLVRDHFDPPDRLVDFDAGLLAAVAGGALGELTWDVSDDGERSHRASGDSADSLADYLDPAAGAEAQQARWRDRFAARQFDARAASTPADLVGALSIFLGASAGVPDDEFDHWLASRVLDSLPRRLELVFSRELYKQGLAWFLDRVHGAQPRLTWSITHA